METTDESCSLAVARWSYGNAVASAAMAWKQKRDYEPVTPAYLELLNA